MPSIAKRLTVAVLAVTLPVAAVAGCGAQKKRTIKAELQSAADNIKASKAMTVTMQLDDARGAVRAAALEDAETADEKALVPPLIGSSISYTLDPVGSTTIGDLSTMCETDPAKLEQELEKSNLSFVVRDTDKEVAELRVVDGTLFVHVDLAEVKRLAELGGAEDFDAQLDELVSEEPDLEQALADVRAGKWIRVPVTEYVDRLQELAESFAEELADTEATPSPTPSAVDCGGIATGLFDAVKPHIKVTDANDDSDNRLLDVTVQARPALKAAMQYLKTQKDLPFGLSDDDLDPADVDKEVRDGTVNGTIALSDGHLKRVTVDLESARMLDPEEKAADSIAGSSLVAEVDDSAKAVVAPTDVSSFDIGDFLEELFSSLEDETFEG